LEQSEDPRYSVVPSNIVDISSKDEICRLEIWAGARQACDDDDYRTSQGPTPSAGYPAELEANIPKDSSPVDRWQQPQTKDVDKAGSEHVGEVDEEDMPSLDCIVGVGETDSSGNQTPSERTGCSD
jgi:hypothetical protein